MSAAALSAAVDSRKPIRKRSSPRRNPLRRSRTLKRQPLFGRGGLGERRFSQRSGLSPSVSPTSSLGEGARGRGLLFREAPSLAIIHNLHAISSAISIILVKVF